MKKNKKGFTIVELVIVIAVIGVLSAILIPTFSNLVNNANEAALQSNLTNAYTEYVSSDEYTQTYLTQKQVYISATQITDSTTDFTTVYEYNNTDKKYVKVDTETTALNYTQIGTSTYNGYYLYTYTVQA